MYKLHIHPGGWETKLAVDHVLRKEVLGVAAPCTFYDRKWY
jgi:hypothetical protein